MSLFSRYLLLVGSATLTAVLSLATSPLTAGAQSVSEAESLSQTPSVSNLTGQAQAASDVQPGEMAQVTSVSELSDVQPTDWAFQAVQSLVERYGCIEGYPDRTFRGNRAATRFELAAALNACLNSISERFVTAEDLASIRALQDEFAAELATLRGRVDAVEARTAELEANQFSTTTKLNGEAIIAPTYGFGGGLDGDDDLDVDDDDPDTRVALGYRVRLNFDTSFTGKDRLRMRLQARDVPRYDRVFDTNMARLGFDGEDGSQVVLDDFNYRFPLGDRGRVSIIANSGEFNDEVLTTFNPYLDSSGSGAISRFGRFNPLYNLSDGGAGAVINYNLTEALGLSVGYLANNPRVAVDTGNPLTEGGLIGSSYSALAQLAFRPSDAFNLGLTYVRSYSAAGSNLSAGRGSDFANSPFGAVPTTSNNFGVEALFRPSTRFALTGWAGYSIANQDSLSDNSANILNYAVALNFPDLGREGNLGAIIFGMPPKVIDNDIAGREDPDTSYHLEGLYKFKVSDNISVTPGIIAIFNPEHDSTRDTVFVGTIRTTFSF